MSPEYFRDYRQKRRARGRCAECPSLARAYRCQRCARRHALRGKKRSGNDEEFPAGKPGTRGILACREKQAQSPAEADVVSF